MFLLFALALSSARAEFIFETATARKLTLEEFAASRPPNQIVVFGERHAMPDDPEEAHHFNQTRLLRALPSHQAAFEFIEYVYQSEVDDLLAGRLSEDEFQKRAHWGSNPWSSYRSQILEGGHTLALNAPATIASAVARGQALTADQQALLPPIWERGSAAYFARFAQAMGGHVPPEKLERYFMAHSLWDDTMAWNALRGQEPGAVQVIIVGEFHVEFGQGLPARLRRQGARDVVTLLQDGPLEEDATNGPRADYIWVTESPST